MSLVALSVACLRSELRDHLKTNKLKKHYQCMPIDGAVQKNS